MCSNNYLCYFYNLFVGLHMIDRSHSSCFQLIGLDITVSNDGHVWFIESNNNINLQSDGWMMDYNYNMIVSVGNIATMFIGCNDF